MVRDSFTGRVIKNLILQGKAVQLESTHDSTPTNLINSRVLLSLSFNISKLGEMILLSQSKTVKKIYNLRHRDMVNTSWLQI